MNENSSPPKLLMLKDEDKDSAIADLKKIQSSTGNHHSLKIIGSNISTQQRKLSVHSTTYNKTICEREPSTNSNLRRESNFDTNDVKLRYDVKGNPIIRGKHKKQRVTFRDLISKEKLVEFVNIPRESNKDDEASKKNEEKDSMSCACLIF